MSVSSRHIGWVLLDGRLCVIRARLRKLRHRSDLASRVHACVDEVERLITRHAPGVIVIETDRAAQCGPATMTLTHAAVDAAQRHLRVIHASVEAVSEHIVGEPRFAKAAAMLCGRYAELRRRIIGPQGKLIRDPLRWRDVRPLVAAYVLAFATGQRAITSLFGDRLSPSKKDDPSSSS